MNLSPHFTYEELTASDYALRHGLANVPPPVALKNLDTLAMGLERVRMVFGSPVVVTSAYRCTAVNEAVGGAANSYHIRGLAADIVIPMLTPAMVCSTLWIARERVQFDKIILEFGRWVHIQFPEDDDVPRREAYQIADRKVGYLPWKGAA